MMERINERFAELVSTYPDRLLALATIDAFQGEAAAKLGMVVFVHPISPLGLTERLSRLGHTGILLARGTENAASLRALLRSGILDELPDLG